jgi:hypothetical protein
MLATMERIVCMLQAEGVISTETQEQLTGGIIQDIESQPFNNTESERRDARRLIGKRKQRLTKEGAEGLLTKVNKLVNKHKKSIPLLRQEQKNKIKRA